MGPAGGGDRGHLFAMRTAIRGERKLAVAYRDGRAGNTALDCPFALAFFDRAQVVVAHA